MKTKTMFAVLFVTMLGCRNEFVELCPGENRIATAVVIESDCVEPDGTSAVTANDTTNADHYKLHAHVWAGDVELFWDAEWSVPDSTLLDLSPIPADPAAHRAASTLVLATADILDLGGDTEPGAAVIACVQNDCSNYAGGEGCTDCLPEVCSDSHMVRSVVNAEGDWELGGATFPSSPRVQLHATQTGRDLEDIYDYYHPEIHGRQINFSSGDVSYVGQFTDRTHVTGEAIRSPVGEDLGEWTAVKCPDTGCG